MKTMARKCSRARYHSPEVLHKEYARAAFECVDWDDTEDADTYSCTWHGAVHGHSAAVSK